MTYSKALSDVVRRGEEVIDNFWNVLDHPDFPFVTLQSTTNAFRNFPPYNIIESEDGKVRLEMAVAGYTKDRITVEKVGNSLIISGKPAEVNAKDLYRQRSISNALWVRSFDMHPSTEVADVQLKDGILTVKLPYKQPELTKEPETKRIVINKG